MLVTSLQRTSFFRSFLIVVSMRQVAASLDTRGKVTNVPQWAI
jgi:hypothetical protein